MRGIFSGSLWALIVGGVGLGIASQIAAPPQQTVVDAPGGDTASETPDAPVVAENVVNASPEPADEPPQPETPAAITPLPEEVVEPSVAELEAPEPETGAVGDVIAPDRPVLSGAPIAPDPVVTLEDAAPAAPEAPSEPDAEIAATPAPVETVPDDAVDGDQPARAPAIAEGGAEPTLAPGAVAEQPAIDDLLAGLQNPDNTLTAEPETVDEIGRNLADRADPEVAEESRAAPVAPEAAPIFDEAVIAPEAREPAEPVAPSSSEIVVEEPTEPEIVAEAAPETVAEPAAETPQSDTSVGVRVNRPGADPTPAPAATTDEIQTEASSEDAPAILRYATPFENPTDLPLINLLLLDDGRVPSADVVALDFPVTVILDPLAPDAALRMKAYRDAGIEVGLRAGLPQGATPSDVEITMEAALAALPEAVVLYSDGEDGVQASRSVADQVVQILAVEGRGFVAVQKGFGNALRFAEQSDVPASEITRNLDELGENEAAIGRALDQTAFRARQSGDAVVVAETSTYMLSALRSWALQNDGGQLRLAPVTAVLGVETVSDAEEDGVSE
ncbi:divergent polysaccharide deacetylase family protein [Yoonia sp. 2307UL14-13]|uniref:divergent polysaccharide deacetylase family protein n=1 Tax=Yoonia sp. 2307UL14-13 TaxID=3126506 RepID=UPI0030A58A9F